MRSPFVKYAVVGAGFPRVLVHLLQAPGELLVHRSAGDAPLPVADQLHLALTDLWQVTLPLRLARMAGSEPDKTIHLSSFSIDPGDGP